MAPLTYTASTQLYCPAKRAIFKSMLDLLKSWLARRRRVTASDLICYPDFSSSTPGDLAAIAFGSNIQVYSPGATIPLKPDPKNAFFLRKGTINVVLRDGSSFPLRHDVVPQAGSLNVRMSSAIEVTCVDRVEFIVADISSLYSAPVETEQDWVTSEDGDGFDEILLEDISAAAGHLALKIVTDLGQGSFNLPVLPELAVAVRRKIEDPNSSAEEIARLIQADPSLSAKLIQMANSPAYLGYDRVTNVLEAIGRVGFDATRDLVAGLSVKELFNVEGLDLKDRMRKQWEHSVRVAAVSSVLARDVAGVSGDQALLAGLMHDVGAFAVIKYVSENPALINDLVELEQAIEQLRGPFGAMILQSWSMDRAVIIAARFTEDYLNPRPGPVSLLDVVQVAHVHALAGLPEMKTAPPLLELPAIAKLGLRVDDAEKSIIAIREARKEIEQIRAALLA